MDGIGLLGIGGIGLIGWMLGALIDWDGGHSSGSGDSEDTADGQDTAGGNAGDDNIINGGAGDDREADALIGGSIDDLINGNAGDDWLFGKNGNDSLYASSGNDLLAGGTGADTQFAGSGDDILIGEEGVDTLKGSTGNDILTGGGLVPAGGAEGGFSLTEDTAGALEAQLRADAEAGLNPFLPHLETMAAADDGTGDILHGGFENDHLLVGSADTVTGGAGNDTFTLGDWIEEGKHAVIEDFDKATDQISYAYDQAKGMPELNLFNDADGNALLSANGQYFAILHGAAEKIALSDIELLPYGEDDKIPDGFTGPDITGGGGDDLLDGTDLGERLFGGDGSDVLIGKGANDALSGSNGNDRLFGNGGDDSIYADDGNDVAFGGEGGDEIWGGSDGDLLVGNEGVDTLYGNAGTDFLIGTKNSTPLPEDSVDFLSSTEHQEMIDQINQAVADGGNPFLPILGMPGPDGDDDAGDLLNAGYSDDYLMVGSEDTATGVHGNDSFTLGDWIQEGRPAEITDFTPVDPEDATKTVDSLVYGYDGAAGIPAITLEDDGAGNVLLKADGVLKATLTGAADQIDQIKVQLQAYTPESGEGTLIGTNADETLSGTDQADTIEGKGGDDSIEAGAGNDLLNGGAGKDGMFGDDGNDTVFGGAGDDFLRGDAGDDLIIDTEGEDALRGNAGNDVIISGNFLGEAAAYAALKEGGEIPDEAFDYASDGDGADQVDGGEGDDLLLFGADDTVTGGGGSDTFMVPASIAAEKPAQIDDFVIGEDKLILVTEGGPLIQVEHLDSGDANILVDGARVAIIIGVGEAFTMDDINVQSDPANPTS